MPLFSLRSVYFCAVCDQRANGHAVRRRRSAAVAATHAGLVRGAEYRAANTISVQSFLAVDRFNGFPATGRSATLRTVGCDKSATSAGVPAQTWHSVLMKYSTRQSGSSGCRHTVQRVCLSHPTNPVHHLRIPCTMPATPSRLIRQ